MADSLQYWAGYMRGRKWIKHALVASLTLTLGLLGLALLASFSPTGNEWLWRQAKQQLPQLDGELVSGSLWRGWTFHDLSWKDESFTIEAEKLVLQWRPVHLLHKQLTISALHIDQPIIRIEESTGTPANTELPSIALPVPITAKSVTLANSRFEYGEYQETIPSIELAVNAKASQLQLTKIEITHPWAALRAQGSIQLDKDYPIALNSHITLNKNPWPDYLELNTVDLTLSGSIEQLGIHLVTSGSMDGVLQGTISPLATGQPFDLELSWERFAWPNTSPLAPVSLLPGQLSATGHWEGFKLELATAAQVYNHPPMQVTLAARGNIEQFTVQHLTTVLGNNKLIAQGQLAGEDWSITADLNTPGLSDLYPGLDGSLQGQLSFQGNFQQANGHYQLQSPGLKLDSLQLGLLQSRGTLQLEPFSNHPKFSGELGNHPRLAENRRLGTATTSNNR